jgi:hypothetical protein
LLDQLFGAIEIALFGLIIRQFRKGEHTASPAEKTLHTQCGRGADGGECVVYRSSNHFRISQINSPARTGELSFKHDSP